MVHTEVLLDNLPSAHSDSKPAGTLVSISSLRSETLENLSRQWWIRQDYRPGPCVGGINPDRSIVFNGERICDRTDNRWILLLPPEIQEKFKCESQENGNLVLIPNFSLNPDEVAELQKTLVNAGMKYLLKHGTSETANI